MEVKNDWSESMKEKTIADKILKYLKAQSECFAFKEHGGMYGTAGIPDIICCYKGQFVAFEVKTPDFGSYKHSRNLDACKIGKIVRKAAGATPQRSYKKSRSRESKTQKAKLTKLQV